jgi:hypothetical protein
MYPPKSYFFGADFAMAGFAVKRYSLQKHVIQIWIVSNEFTLHDTQDKAPNPISDSPLFTMTCIYQVLFIHL